MRKDNRGLGCCGGLSRRQFLIASLMGTGLLLQACRQGGAGTPTTVSTPTSPPVGAATPTSAATPTVVVTPAAAATPVATPRGMGIEPIGADRPAGTPAPPDQQVLRVLTPSPFRMDPITYAGDLWQLQMIVYQSLTRVEVDGSLVGGVADRWETPDNGKTWIFYLNPDAKFSDGSPITAHDVKWTYDWATNPESKCWDPDGVGAFIKGYEKQKAGETKSLEGVIVKDDRTIIFELNEPYGGFPLLAANFTVGVLKKDNVLEGGEEWWRNPVTSGIYRVTEYTPGSQATMTLEPNPYWWREKPILQKVTFRLVPDPQTQLVMYDNNEADCLPAQPADFAEARKPGGRRHADLYWDMGPGWWYLAFVCDRPPFNDVKVRQAFASAVNWAAISEAALNGIYPPLRRLITPDIPCGGTEQFMPTFDPDRAKQLIKESSIGSLDKLPKIYFLVPEAGGATALGTWGRVAVAIQQQLLETLGVYVEVNRVQWRQMVQLAREVDGGAVIRASGGGVVPDPGSLLDTFITGRTTNTQLFNYSNPKVDELIAQGNRETDPKKRCEYFTAADKQICEDAVFLAGFQGTSAWFLKPKVRGFKNVLGRIWPSLHRMYIAKE